MSEEMRNTVQEPEETLKKKKKPVTRERIKVWITFGVATVILGIIPCFLLFPIGILFSGICMLMLLFVWLPASLKKVKRCFCPECGEKYDYDNDVEWEVSEIEIKEKITNPKSDRKQLAGIRIEHVDVECHCANCGATNSFSHKFRTGEVYDDGQVNVKNIQIIVKKYFKL